MSSSHSWFVQTGFGTVLGPMPTDALSEMVRTGALIASDLVRADNTVEWEPATNVPGLFSSSPLPLPRPTEATLSTSTKPSQGDHSEQQHPAPLAMPSSFPASDRPAKQKPTETVAYAFDKSVAPQPTPEVDLVAQWKAERQQRPRRHVESNAVGGATPEIIPDIFADDLPENDHVSKEIVPSGGALIDFDQAPATASTDSRQAIKLPSLLSQIAPDLPALPTETFAQIRDRWKRSLPSKPIMAAAMVLVLSAWWFWPHSRRPIYSRLVAIWSELKIHRAHPLDKSGMTDFVARTQTELDAIIPTLIKHTKSNDREITLLLHAARDCLQPILKRPRESDVSREKQLESCLQELAASYGLPINAPLPNATPSIEPIEPDTAHKTNSAAP